MKTSIAPSALLISAFIAVCIAGCTKSSTNETAKDSADRVAKKNVTRPAPSVFEQVVGNKGTADMQIFDNWVIVYEYPTEAHQLLGVAAKATVVENKGTRNKPDLGEKIATATLSTPATFARSKADYPLMPPEIVVDESHFKKGKVAYSGRLTFKPMGEVSKRTGDASLSGETSADYFISWPMFNYVIEQRMPRGTTRVWTIELNPER